ncbi:MAG: hypothetical protein C0623_11340 [Desulfuromonas sp.]|nr:MAG: hypothetical protein C0623_11340 [Desulfuromonas sp.]
MKLRDFWKSETATYFNVVTGIFVFVLIIVILYNSLHSLETRQSLERYMENLRDVIFLSTYDSLKKGNMKVFTNHLQEVGTFDDVHEFSLIDTKGMIRYSSNESLVGKMERGIIGLQQQKIISRDGRTTYFFPVETTNYCSRCHADWKVGSINSYYLLSLSREAIDDLKSSTIYYHGIMTVSGLAFVLVLFSLAVYYERRKSEEHNLVSASVQNFMDSVDDPFLSVDANGICTFCNRSGLELFGFASEEMIVGRNVHEAIQHTAEDGSPVDDSDYILTRMLDSGRSIKIDEVLLWRADGTYFIGECRLHPIIRRGNISGATISLFDVTQKKAEDLRTINLSQMASLGELAAGVAHEINNPISGVINYTQLYKNRYGGDTEGDELLGRIIKEGKRISSIVYSLLNYAHQGSDKTEPVDMVGIVSETLNLFKVRLEAEGIDLDVSIDEQIPRVNGNFQNLEQVLMNLISNARYALNKKYPENHHVDKILRIVLERVSGADGSLVRLTVYDRGIGIPADMINKVMNPFVTTKPAGEGTGLGLHVCFNIIQQHNGRIDIESDQGDFTRVTVTLPGLD